MSKTQKTGMLGSSRLCGSLINLVALTLLIVFLPRIFTKTSDISLIWTCCVFVIMATSLNITMGFMGQLALGHCGFMAIGAYVSTWFANLMKAQGFFQNAYDSNYYIVLICAILIGGVATALVGLIVGAPALRLHGDYLAIITLGFGLIAKSVLDNIASPTLYAQDCNMYIADKIKGRYLWFILLVTVLSVALMFTFIRSKYGRALKSIRDDDIASSASGINTSFYKILGFVFSAFFAGIAGVLYAAMMSSLSTASFAFSNSSIYNSIFIVVMVVLGGMGSLTGSVVAAAGMVYLNKLITSVPESSFLFVIARYPMLLYALVLIVFIMFRPKGLLGTYEFSLYGTLRAIPQLFRRRKQPKEDADHG